MSKSDKPDFLDWFGLRQPPVLTVAKFLGPALSVVVILLFMMAVAAAFGLLGHALFDFGWDGPRGGFGTGAVAVALISAPFVVWRAIVAQKTVDVAEQGHITDRINKAVEMLGAEKSVKRDGEEFTQPNLEVRIGAIYALERIAQDSDRDHVQIMEILCAYIRQNARTSDLTPAEPPFEAASLRVDLQAAIDVIGRRSEGQKTIERAERYRLDLRGSDLSFASFARGDFSAAILASCKLEACDFRDCNLSGAILNSSILNFSDFFRCNLLGARLDACKINRPVAQPGSWTPSINMGELKGVSFPSADLSAIQHLGSKDKMNQMMGSKDTILSPNLRHKMPPSDVMEKNSFRGMSDLDKDDVQALNQIEDAGFKYWFPFDAKRDLAFGPARKEFLQSMGLDGWPYIEE